MFETLWGNITWDESPVLYLNYDGTHDTNLVDMQTELANLLYLSPHEVQIEETSTGPSPTTLANRDLVRVQISYSTYIILMLFFEIIVVFFVEVNT